jgi:hypothetical protein
LDEKNKKLDYLPHHWNTESFTRNTAKYPITGVTPEQAQAFCVWLTGRESDKGCVYRLPISTELNKIGSAYWVLSEEGAALAEGQNIAVPLNNWILESDDSETNRQLGNRQVSLASYHPMQYLGSSYIWNTIQADIAHTLAGDIANASASARNIANNLTNIHVSDFALPSDSTRTRASARSKSRTLANKLADCLVRTSAGASDGVSASDLANELADNLANAIARASILANDFADNSTHYIDSNFARAIARDFVSANDLIRILARNLAITRNVASDLTIVRTKKLASDLTNELTSDLAGGLVLALVRDLALARTLARTLDSNLDSTSDPESGLSGLLTLFKEIADIITDYILLSLITSFNSTESLIPILKQNDGLTLIRQQILSIAQEWFKKQPRRTRFGDNSEWDTWDKNLNDLLCVYATLAMLERRRTGEWEAFEGIRIVKERREKSQPAR